MQWETAHDDNLSSTLARGGLHFVSDVSHLESKIVVLENMLKELSHQIPHISQTFMVSCSHYEALGHSLSVYYYFAHQLSIGIEQVNKAY